MSWTATEIHTYCTLYILQNAAQSQRLISRAVLMLESIIPHVCIVKLVFQVHWLSWPQLSVLLTCCLDFLNEVQECNYMIGLVCHFFCLDMCNTSLIVSKYSLHLHFFFFFEGVCSTQEALSLCYCCIQLNHANQVSPACMTIASHTKNTNNKPKH